MSRFIKRHGYLRRLQKRLEANRESAEDIETVNEYFLKLRQVLETYGIPPSDIWNMDETGFRIGTANNDFIVTKRSRAHFFGIPENRESATAIEAISAAGRVTPGFLILSGQTHMANWYRTPEIPEDMAISVSPTGYSNDEVSLGWIKHFQLHTAPLTVGQKRLLILDGHGSHHASEFIQYYNDHDIVPFGLPPHLTHILQPLDVVVFQPLKHYHSKAINILVRDGLTSITKLEFLGCIQGVRNQAFKESTIKSAFEKTGIYPFHPHRVLKVLEERAPRHTTPPLIQAPRNAYSSPIQTPTTVRHVNKAAYHIQKAIKESVKMDPALALKINRFIKGSILNTTELLQVTTDLSRTRLAERVAKQRRAAKNTPLKSGGILTVADGRRMVQQLAEDEVMKARRIIEVAEERFRKATRNCYKEAAKKARNWRLSGRLLPAEIVDGNVNSRFLRRF